jgi:hypothetical protein
MAAAIFGLSRRSIFIQPLPNKEQRRSLMALEAGKDELRNWIEGQVASSPEIGDERRVKVHAYSL